MPQEAASGTTIAPDIGITGTSWGVLQPLLAILLWGVSVAIVAGWLALAVIHIADDYRITHTQGVWIATAESARAGRMYPPLFDGEHYAGTRYMPLPILFNAFASHTTGNPVTGGKLLAAALMTALLSLVVTLLRHFACPWPIAVGLATGVVATEAGLQAGTTIGGDSLPVVLQLSSLALVLMGRTQRFVLLGGAAAGLAIGSKLTGVWGGVAVVTWLVLQRRWTTAGTFAVACLGTAAAIVTAAEVLSGGDFSQHVTAFSAAGIQSTSSVLRAPNQVVYNLHAFAKGTVVLLPLAILGALLASWRGLPVVHVALAYALGLLLVIYADLGTGFNQLLDVVVLTALAVGHLAGRAARNVPPYSRVVILAVTVSVIWAAGIDVVRTVAYDLRQAVPVGRPPTRAAEVVARLVQPGEHVLAEDPSVDVAMGRRPLIMDPFMLRRLDRTNPELVDPLISRIKDRRFDLVVLLVSLEDRNLDYWWSDYHFGPRIATALRASYRPERWVGRYLLYRPVR